VPEPNPTSLIPFTFDGAPVRALLVDGEPHFVGKDVAERLGYADPTTAIKSHCRGVQKLHPIQDALGRTQQARILAEPDVLRLIVGSKLPAAERFERWVFEEVLPTIRKTGAYTAPGATPEPAALPFRDSLDAVQLAATLFGASAALEVWNGVGGLPRISSAATPAEPRQPDLFTPPTRGRIAAFAGINKPGRKPILTDAVLAAIDARIQAGATKRAACEAEGVSYETMKMAVYRARLAATRQH